ncbi:MAG: VCBS repeat-containing protein [Chthoniobacterales bacterium]
MKFLRLAGLTLLLHTTAAAQAPAPAAPKDAIRNGGFERTLQAPNLWSGVDRDGFLAGFRGFLPVLTESGSIAETPMPVGVAVGDLNGDGLPDMLTSDPLGYIRVYFNSGSKEQPKFTSGELSLPWLASGEGDPPWLPPALGGVNEAGGWNQKWAKRRLGVRASLSETAGGKDLVAGNYFGDIIIVRNTGSAQSPQFPQPQPLTKAIVPTSKDPAHRWGNVFAPLLHDWDGDGKPDLLVGEGSYSANNVHLFLNQGSAASPVFNEDKRQPLALGEGRQQLTPALADVNGNGRLDLLVADRSGRITAYLRPDNWKWGESIAPSGFLAKNGGLTSGPSQALVLGSGIHTIATGDLNGDGLFDLVVGKSNGRLAWSANQGSKESPKFNPPADLTGDKPVPLAWQLPSQWDVDIGTARGNFLAYASSVTAQEDATAQPVEGTRALKFGYTAAPNSVLPRPSLFLPASREFDRKGDRGSTDSLFRGSAEQRGTGAPSNFFILRQPVQMEIGKSYALTFQAKGNKVSNASYAVGWRAFKQTGEDRLVRGERGAVQRQRNSISDSDQQSADFRPAGNWSTVSKTYKIEFKKERDLNKEKFTSEGILEISFELGAPDGFLYLDDIKLVPQG